MVRRLHLLISAVLTLSLSAFGAEAAAATQSGPCTTVRQKLGLCNTAGTSDGSGVDVTGTVEHGNGGTGDSASPASGAGRALTDDEIRALLDEACYGNGVCATRTALSLNPVIPIEPGAPGADGAPAQTVTISDLARFLPASAALHA